MSMLTSQSSVKSLNGSPKDPLLAYDFFEDPPSFADKHCCGKWWKSRQRCCGVSCCPRWSIGLLCCVAVAFTLVLVAGLSLFFSFGMKPLVAYNIQHADVDFSETIFTNPRLVPHPELGQVWKVGMVSKGAIKPPSLGVDMTVEVEKNNLHVYHNGLELGYVPMPVEKSTGKYHFNVNSTLTVVDPSVWASMASEMLRNKTVESTLKASLDIKVISLAGITYHDIHFSKHISSKGLDNLSAGHGVKAVSFNSSNATHINIMVEAFNYNPTHYVVDPLGDLTIQMYYKGNYLAELHAPNVSMTLGNNTILFGGFVNNDVNLTIAAELMRAYLSNETVFFDVLAPNVTTNIPLYNPALVGFSVKSRGKPVDRAVIESVHVVEGEITPINDTHIMLYNHIQQRVFVPLGPNTPVSLINVSVQSNLYYQGVKIGSLRGPPFNVPNGNETIQDIYLNATLELDGASGTDAWVKYTVDFHRDKSVSMQFRDGYAEQAVARIAPLKGPIELHHVALNPVTTVLSGLDRLKGTYVDHLEMPMDNPNGPGVVVKLNASIFNPSHATIHTGRPVFAMKYKGASMGQVTADEWDVVLSPGWNVVPSTGVVFIDAGDAHIVSGMFDAYLTGRNASVTSTIVRTIGPYQNVSWVQRAAKQLNVTNTMLPLGESKRKKLVGPAKILNGNVTFDTHGHIAASANITNHFYPPFAFPLTILSAGADVNVTTGAQDDPHTHTVASFLVPVIPITTTNASSNEIRGAFSSVPLKVVNETAFRSLAILFAREQNISFYTKGLVENASALSALSPAPIIGGGVTFDNPSTIVGLGGLKHPGSVSILGAEVVGATEDTVMMAMDVRVNNPSTTNIAGGNVFVDVMVKGPNASVPLVKVANATLDGLVLAVGNNTYTRVPAWYTNPPGDLLPVGLEFLASFIQGNHTPIIGRCADISVPLLVGGCHEISVETVLPGVSKPFVVSANIENIGLFSSTLDVNMVVINTFGVPLEIISLDVHISLTSDGMAVGHLNTTGRGLPISVGANTTAESPKMTMEVSDLSEEIYALLEIIFGGGETHVNVNGEIQAKVDGEFTQTIAYRQNNIPTTLYASSDEGGAPL